MMGNICDHQADEHICQMLQYVIARISMLIFISQRSRGTINSKQRDKRECDNYTPDYPITMKILFKRFVHI